MEWRSVAWADNERERGEGARDGNDAGWRARGGVGRQGGGGEGVQYTLPRECLAFTICTAWLSGQDIRKEGRGEERIGRGEEDVRIGRGRIL